MNFKEISNSSSSASVTVMLTSQNIVEMRASVHSASFLLVLVISRRKTIHWIVLLGRLPTEL